MSGCLRLMPEGVAARAVNPMEQYGRNAGLAASVLDLGIGPQINASWMLQGLTAVEALSGTQFGLKEIMRSGFEARPTSPRRAADAVDAAPAASFLCRWEMCTTRAGTVLLLLRPHGVVCKLPHIALQGSPGQIMGAVGSNLQVYRYERHDLTAEIPRRNRARRG